MRKGEKISRTQVEKEGRKQNANGCERIRRDAKGKNGCEQCR